jgi:hypothetical protein
VGIDGGDFKPILGWCPIFHFERSSILVDVASVRLKPTPVGYKCLEFLKLVVKATTYNRAHYGSTVRAGRGVSEACNDRHESSRRLSDIDDPQARFNASVMLLIPLLPCRYVFDTLKPLANIEPRAGFSNWTCLDRYLFHSREKSLCNFLCIQV